MSLNFRRLLLGKKLDGDLRAAEGELSRALAQHEKAGDAMVEAAEGFVHAHHGYLTKLELRLCRSVSSRSVHQRSFSSSAR